MDIYTILSTKPHNPHYLNRYCNFIQSCKEKNITLPDDTYIERHHICPKAKDLFPEYKSLKHNPWNEVKLTRRQHILAHYILAKCYNTWGMWEAIKRLIHHPQTGHNNFNGLLKLVSTNTKNTKKGVFTRGYLADGTPNVKQETKDLLSKQKKEYYSNPENIEKCKEVRNSDVYTNANKLASERFIELNKSRTGIPLSDETKLKLSISLKKAFSNVNVKKKFKKFKLYVTPIGVFCSVNLPLCKLSTHENDIINSHHTKGTSVITNKVKGLTFRQIGFYTISKEHPEFEQYCALLGLIHQPEPSHPLASELNDFLLQRKLLP